MENKHIFIGKNAHVTNAPNKSLIGLSGMIVNETKNTLVFEKNNSHKKVLKNGVTISIDGKEYVSNSKTIEDRIKSR